MPGLRIGRNSRRIFGVGVANRAEAAVRRVRALISEVRLVESRERQALPHHIVAHLADDGPHVRALAATTAFGGPFVFTGAPCANRVLVT